MSLQLLIDSVNAGAVNACDFGDAVAASFESSFPRAVALFDDAPKPSATQELQRFKLAGKPDFGDRVAAAYDQLFPPRGATL